MKVTKQTFATFTRKKVPLANTIHHSSFIYIQLKRSNLCKFYPNQMINHLNEYSEALTMPDSQFSALWTITITSKTKPSSQALHPIKDAYFHQSPLKRKQDCGHQAVSIMLSCNSIVLNYAFVLYNKSFSKINIVQNISKELPIPLVIFYFPCDC